MPKEAAAVPAGFKNCSMKAFFAQGCFFYFFIYHCGGIVQVLRAAVIDIGTNSTRLLIADVENRKIKVLNSVLVSTRLGEGIEKRRLSAPAMHRTLHALRDYLEIIKSWRVERTVAVATSAVRGAKNKADFLQAAYLETGLKIEVISGRKEAFYSYQGVLSSLSPLPSKVAVIDIGGGSTEFIWPKNNRIFLRSINVGAVRATEGRYTENQIRQLVKPAVAQMKETAPERLVGVGGTVTTLAAMALQLPVYDPNLVHGYVLKYAQIEALFSLLAHTGYKERRELPGLQPERADIIVAGVQIVLLVLAGLELDSLQVSEADLMYGLTVEMSK